MKPLVLKAPPTYWAMPEKERNRRYEGCGPGHLGDLVVPDSIWGLNITDACRIHDHCYEIGETSQDKIKADLWLLRNMTVIIYRDTRLKCLIRPRRKLAYSYFMAVSHFGHHAFWANKPKP